MLRIEYIETMTVASTFSGTLEYYFTFRGVRITMVDCNDYFYLLQDRTMSLVQIHLMQVNRIYNSLPLSRG